MVYKRGVRYLMRFLVIMFLRVIFISSSCEIPGLSITFIKIMFRYVMKIMIKEFIGFRKIFN